MKRLVVSLCEYPLAFDPFACVCFVFVRGNSVPKAPAAGAEQLERSQLTDFLEEQLNEALKKERKERAEKEGKPIHEIPTAEPLYLRMVVNTDKLQQVRGFRGKSLSQIALLQLNSPTFDYFRTYIFMCVCV